MFFRVAVNTNVLGVRRALDVCRQLPLAEVGLAIVTIRRLPAETKIGRQMRR